MKEAGALAEASQGDPIHKKKAPDWGDRSEEFCERSSNPMKSAEIATEHNYNMLDGVLNNQAPPRRKRSWIRLRNRPTSTGAGNGRNDDKETPPPDPSPCDGIWRSRPTIQQRMAEAGIRNMELCYGKWPSMAMCSMLTSRPSGSWYHSSGGAQTTSIKWQSRPTPTAGFSEEIAALQRDYAALWGPLSDLLKKLSALVEL